MTTYYPSALTTNICRALRLDPSYVRSIELVLDVGNVPIARVELLAVDRPSRWQHALDGWRRLRRRFT